MTLPPVRSGELVEFKADVENAQLDFINLLMQATGYDNGQFGSTGFSFLSGFAAPHAIFELQWTCNNGTCYVVWDPDDDDAPVPPGLDSVPDVPYTLQARRVWVNHQSNTYGQADLSPDTAIYFPLAVDVDDVGGYSDGERVPAWYDEQSGRWWSLTNRATLSSSSSGVEASSSSSSGVEPSSSSSSSGVEPSSSSSSSGVEESSSSSSSGVVCGFTGVFTVGDGNIVRNGDFIEEGRYELEFENGLLCERNFDGIQQVYLCCPDSSGIP